MATGEDIKRRREALGLSQPVLATLAETDQQTIWRIERGAHSRALPAVLAALAGAEAKAAAGELVRTEIIPKRPPATTGDLPVYASARGGPGEILFTYDPVDYVGRPDPLASVRDGFAMYIVGDSMSPAFEQGDLALVNPHVPFRGGDDVLVLRDWEGEQAAVIKRLVKATADEWHVEQFNPPKKFKLSRTEWPQCHVIVGKYSRR